MSDESESYQKLVVRYGFLVRVVEFRSIKLITTFLILLLVIDLFFSCKLFVSAIQIRSHLGYFINMVSSGDGDTLPSLQAVPVLFFFVTNVVMSFFLFSAFDNFERSSLNRLMFFTILFGAILLLVVFIIIICVISHAYSAHESLHDGDSDRDEPLSQQHRLQVADRSVTNRISVLRQQEVRRVVHRQVAGPHTARGVRVGRGM
jgi:hypothetical protein